MITTTREDNEPELRDTEASSAVVTAYSVVNECSNSKAELGKLLVIAAKKGSKTDIDALLVRGADVNHLNALVCAAVKGHVEVVTLLVDRGASVDAADKYGWTALHRAVGKGHFEVVALLVDRGASLDAPTQKHGPLALWFEAAAAGHTLLARRLLDRGAVDVDVRRKEKKYFNLAYPDTALLRAAHRGYLELATLLLDRGALPDGPNLPDDLIQGGLKGETALQRAARYDHLEIVKLLLTRGASADTRTRGYIGTTSSREEAQPMMLHWATDKYYFEVVKLLVERGASLDATYEGGNTALALGLGNYNLFHRQRADSKPENRKAWRNICVLLMRAMGVAGCGSPMFQGDNRGSNFVAGLIKVSSQANEDIFEGTRRNYSIRSDLATLRSLSCFWGEGGGGGEAAVKWRLRRRRGRVQSVAAGPVTVQQTIVVMFYQSRYSRP